MNPIEMEVPFFSFDSIENENPQEERKKKSLNGIEIFTITCFISSALILSIGLIYVMIQR